MKVLIIRFSSIGDIVLTSPVIRCLKEQTDAEIHYITKEQFTPVLKANPYIDKVYSIRKKIQEVASEIRKEKYDYVIDLHKNIRSLQLKRLIKSPSASFNKLNIQKWLLVNLKINKLPDIHIVDRYFEAVKPLDVTNDKKGLDYFIPADEELKNTDLPKSFQDDYIAIVIGGKHNTKIYPEEKLMELIGMLDSNVILLGGPEDKPKGEKIAESFPGKVYNSCGEYSLNQSAGIVRNARLVLTNDTGLMHIAAAFQKTIISTWGNTVPGFGMYPYLPGNENHSHIMEVKGLSCRPCSKIGFDKCPKKHFDCMNQIDNNEIAQIIYSTNVNG